MCIKNNRSPKISIDATGGLVHKPILSLTLNIFLYQIGVRNAKNKCQYSVGHIMSILSERHDNNSIAP